MSNLKLETPLSKPLPDSWPQKQYLKIEPLRICLVYTTHHRWRRNQNPYLSESGAQSFALEREIRRHFLKAQMHCLHLKIQKKVKWQIRESPFSWKEEIYCKAIGRTSKLKKKKKKTWWSCLFFDFMDVNNLPDCVLYDRAFCIVTWCQLSGTTIFFFFVLLYLDQTFRVLKRGS